MGQIQKEFRERAEDEYDRNDDMKFSNTEVKF